MDENEASVSIEGTVRDVVFYNEENDYAVLDVEADDGLLITVVGNIALPAEGERVKLSGHYTYHKEFGKQLVVEYYEKSLPATEEEILTYLSSQTVKGIGPKTARKIVDKFGTDSFFVIENHPEWLTDISGITSRKAAEMSSSFREQNALLSLVSFVRGFMDVAEATRIYKRFGQGSVQRLKDNPYTLCEGPQPISFPRVDEMARQVGYDKLSPERLYHAIRYILSNHGVKSGHVCLPVALLVSEATRLLSLDTEDVRLAVHSQLKDGVLSSYMLNDELYIQTDYMAKWEDTIARGLLELERYAIRYSASDADSLITSLEASYGLTYASRQRLAIREALAGGVMVLTGGPGTGKTTVVKALLSIFGSMNLSCVLAAPTGRAAKRMSEATSHEAMTVHRLLEATREGASGDIVFGKDKSNPIDKKVIIVDEASMLDTQLTYHLISAISRGTRLILIGDKNQLPSVGAGNVLADIIGSGAVRTVTLDEIFRQSEKSLIVTNAHRINKGELPDLSRTDRDFFFLRRDENDIPEAVCELITKRLPKKYGRNVAQGIQTVTPSKQGVGGILSLNAMLQERLNPPRADKTEHTSHGTTFRLGDKVMQTVNNYELMWEKDGEEGIGIFNGDIGVITKIDNAEKNMTVDFDGRVTLYGFDILQDLELAYAITVHKSQGSEYPIVIMPIYSCPFPLRSRNLLYTAVTRAKNMVILIGNPDLLPSMIENNREVRRNTTLRERLVRLNA
ncbi:MAG: ATP-dependent RecD-like DNA helicase [Clostridia bacterium]|nr:ATP-dependent RecD-like DNA helicase [Clostridia bacterium]